MKLPITSINIGERQRLTLGDLSDLDSMSDPDVGLIQPIVVHKLLTGYELVAGRRRLAKAVELGWPDIEVVEKDTLTEVQKQKQELFEDVARLDRPWQDRCLSIAKLHGIMRADKAANGEKWTIKHTAIATGFGYTQVWKLLEVADILRRKPQDEECWQCTSFSDAFAKCVIDRKEREARAELDRRRDNVVPMPDLTIVESTPQASVSQSDTDPIVELPKLYEYTLKNRISDYNNAYGYLEPPNTPLVCIEGANRTFVHGFWWIGLGTYNVSDYYGSYQKDYLERMSKLFGDLETKRTCVHLFSGSLPPSENYSRVGVDGTGTYSADYSINAEELSSLLPFRPRLIYADPPYSVEDADHYENSLVNRAKVVEECALILQPGGFLVWMDQAMPVFSNKLLTHVGAIGYIRGTGNRFRMITIFQRNANHEASDYI